MIIEIGPVLGGKMGWKPWGRVMTKGFPSASRCRYIV